MKNWKKIFIIVAFLIIIASIAYSYLVFKGRFMLADKLGQVFGGKVNIGQVIIKPPFNLEIKDLEIGDLVDIESIYISPSIPYLLSGKIALNKVIITHPKINCERSQPLPQAVNGNVLVPDAPKLEKPKETAAAKDNLQLVIKSLKINSGEINFTDHTSDLKTVTFVLKNIDLDLVNLNTFPVNVPANFKLNALLPWKSKEPDGKISLDGWVNLFKKDMLANLKIENIDAIAFYPYYSNWVDLEKARIEKAKLNFSSKIKGENNDISAQCHLELADIVRKVRAPEEPQQKAERLTDAVLDMFKSMNQGKVVLDFTLHTKMDRPEFGFGNIKSAFEGKLMQGRTNAGLRPQDMLLWPGKMVQSGIKSGTNLSNAALDGIFALGHGIKKFFEDAMNKPAPAN